MYKQINSFFILSLQPLSEKNLYYFLLDLILYFIQFYLWMLTG